MARATNPQPGSSGVTRKPAVPGHGDRNWTAFVAVLIGLVSLTGAFLTWKALELDSKAAGAERQAVLDKLSIEKAATAAEVQAAFEERTFAEYVARLAAAEQFQAAAATAAARSDPAAVDLQRREGAERALATNLLASQLVSSDYLTGAKSSDLKFDKKRRVDDLIGLNPYVAAAPSDPDRTEAQASRLHERSLRLVRFVIALAAVVVLLTLTQLVRKELRAWLAAAGMALFLIVAVAAFVGDVS